MKSFRLIAALVLILGFQTAPAVDDPNERYFLTCTCQERWNLHHALQTPSGVLCDEASEHPTLWGTAALDLPTYDLTALQTTVSQSRLCEQAAAQVLKKAEALYVRMKAGSNCPGETSVVPSPRASFGPETFRASSQICDRPVVQLHVRRKHGEEVNEQSYDLATLIESFASRAVPPTAIPVAPTAPTAPGER